MTTPDPMQGTEQPPGYKEQRLETNDPHIGPVAGEPPLPRHSVPPRTLLPPDALISAGEKPIIPVDSLVNAPAVEPALHQRVTATEGSLHNIGAGVLITGGLAVLALILVIVTGCLYIAQRSTIGDLQAQTTANATEAARKDAVQRQATCQLVAALRGTASTVTRVAWPTGTAGYDAFQAALTLSAATLNCDAG